MCKIFISYTHDSDEHCQKVEELAAFFIGHGIDTELDQYTPHPSEGWPIYMLRHILDSDFTLCVCTETYKARFEQKEKIGVGLGAKFEGKVITQLVYESELNEKFIPILLDSSYDSKSVIPTVLGGVQWYNISNLEDLVDLYARISKQEVNKKPPLGKVIPIDQLRKQLGLPTTKEKAEINITQKCIRRFIANGLTQDMAKEIFEAILRSNKFDYLIPEEQQIVYVIGDYGSGKSLALSVLYMQKLRRGENVFFINANQLSLEYTIEQYIDLNKNETVTTIFIDGLDEVNFAIYKHIVDDINIITRLNKNINFVVSSRPIQPLINLYSNDIVYLKPLDRDAAYDLIIKIAGDSAPIATLNGWDETFWQTVSNPFFAIICGLYLKESGTSVNLSKPELITHLIMRSINNSDLDKKLKNWLEIISSKYIFNGMRKILLSELDSSIELDAVLKTGFVQIENGYLTFNLPIVVQWFGAEAIKSGIIKIDDIVKTSNSIAAWRYSIMILIGNISFEESFNILSLIVNRYPGIVSTIIKDNIIYEEYESLPSAQECANRISRCIDVWGSSIPSLAKYIAPVDNMGRPHSFKFMVSENFIHIWWNKSHGNIRYEIVSEPPTHYAHYYSTRISKTPIWPWIITFSLLSMNLKNLITSKPVFVDVPALKEEAIFVSARKLLRKGSLYREDISIDDLVERINKRGGCNEPLLLDKIAELKSEGKKVIVYPYTKPDRKINGGYVWDVYSESQQLILAQEIYSKALTAYQQLCDGLFRGLSNVMPIRIMLPSHMYMEYYYSESIYGRSPYVQWWLNCKNEGQDNSVSIVKTQSKTNYDLIFKNIQASIMQYRLNNYALCPVSVHSEMLHIFNELPLTNLVMSWLKQDLKSINWI